MFERWEFSLYVVYMSSFDHDVLDDYISKHDHPFSPKNTVGSSHWQVHTIVIFAKNVFCLLAVLHRSPLLLGGFWLRKASVKPLGSYFAKVH